MKLIAVIAAALLAGCGAAPPAGGTLPALDVTVLAGRGLAGSSLPELQLLATPRGRELLSRVVSCALPRGATITTITGSGTPYSFTGSLGLAPGWAHHAPTADERRSVEGCVRAWAGSATA